LVGLNLRHHAIVDTEKVTGTDELRLVVIARAADGVCSGSRLIHG
jgi:hypothetical protein